MVLIPLNVTRKIEEMNHMCEIRTASWMPLTIKQRAKHLKTLEPLLPLLDDIANL